MKSERENSMLDNKEDSGLPEETQNSKAMDALTGRRRALKAIGIGFIVGGMAGRAKALSMLTQQGSPNSNPGGAPPIGPALSCGYPSTNGVGYNDDLICAPSPEGNSDAACGLITSGGFGAGAGGAGYNDADCNASATDEDCGISNGATGAHVDANCGPGGTDSDCGMMLGILTRNTDSDCGASGDGDNYSDCLFFDTSNKPNRGNDPWCIHLDSN